MADNSTRRRVKLYMLNDNRVWDDQGTGHVSSAYVEKFKGMSLLVRSETDGSLLLESKIQPHTAYQKQQDTLIVWSEADNYDFALSFQDKAGCDEIWEKICQVQGKDPSVEITQDIVEPESEEMEDDRFEEIPDTAPPIELPPCELSKLEEISELFNSVLLSPIRREKLSLAIRSDGYIKKLLDVFHMCEDLDNMDGLHHLYDIFKSIFLLNETMLFEIMFEEDVIFDVIGVLEYDPSLVTPAKHRHYLRNKAHFKQVIPLGNKALVSKIHQIYRVQYIQDVILPTPSVFEENMLSTLTSFIYFGKVEIVTLLQQDEKFLQSLFARLTDDEVDDEKRKDLVLFLKEFCTFSQTMQPQNRESFFNTLSNLGVLGAIEIILGLEDDGMKSAAIDIFSYIVEFSPSMVREYVLSEAQKQDDEDLLINLVIEQMVTDSDPELGGAVQLSGIIRLLIDPENMMGTTNKTEKSEFLGFFYKHCMHVLTAPLFANTVEDKPSRDDYQTSQLLSLILELLTFCIEHHTYHVKNYIMTKDLVRRILVLLRSRHAFLALAALRLLRRTVGLKDEFYNRYLIKGNLFEPVVKAFVRNGHKYNLFNSAVIELFEFIRMEDMKSLTSHIVERHYKAFEDVDYVKTFKNLKQRYDQQQDRLKDKSPSLDSMPAILRGGGSGPARFRRDPRSLEEEEELWFNQEDDFDDGEMGAANSNMPIADMMKNKLDSDLDHQISKFLERNKSPVRETEHRESPPRMFNRTNSPINIALSKSPPPTCPTPATSPQSSPHNNSSNNSAAGSSSPLHSASGTTSPTRNGSPPLGASSDSPSPPTVSGANVTPGSSPAAATATADNTDDTNNKSASPAVQTKKPGMVGLVDYDEDSEEEEEEESSSSSSDPEVPAAKRQRLST